MQNDCELARDRDLGLERANRAGSSIVDAMPSRRVVDGTEFNWSKKEIAA